MSCRSRYNCNSNMMETTCNNVPALNESDYFDECKCGFDEFNVFPEYPMFGQSYVPIQTMERTFLPCEGLKHGTMFPELVSPYYPNQNLETWKYIAATNKIGKGCNQ